MPRTKRLLLVVALLAFVIAGFSRISFDVDILKLLPVHLRQVEGLSLFLKHFAQSDELMITVEGGNAEKAADQVAEILGARPDLAKRAVARAPWEKHPEQLSEMLAFIVLNQPPEKARALAERMAPANTAATLQDALDRVTDSVSPQEIALRSHDPFDIAGSAMSSALMASAQRSEFSSQDGQFHVVYVTAPQHFTNYKATIAWLKKVRAALKPVDAEIHFTGEPAFVASISASTETDMMSSGIVTLLVIALIFWLCYRRAKPLLELQGMLLLIFALTLAFAGLFFSQLTVIGVGCAAIMIGLSVDYGYFVYQRARRHEGTVRELQLQCVQYIMWTAGTTAAVFFALNASSLPGLSQLGNLVGTGVLFGAAVMLLVFAPLCLKRKRAEGEAPAERLLQSPLFHRVGAALTLAVVLVGLAALAIKGTPPEDFSTKSMQPRNSEAHDAMDRVYAKLADDRNLLSLIVRGKSVDDVHARLQAVEARLAAMKGDLKSYQTAAAIWPAAANQQANLPLLAPLAAETNRLREATLKAGFNEEAFALTENVLKQWASWKEIWPSNEASRWIFRRLAAHSGEDWYALGFVQPAPGKEEAVARAVQGDDVYLVGWNLLGDELKRVIPREFLHVIIGLVVAVLALLALAFRSAWSLLLFVAATALVLATLTGLMSLFGMTWNFFNFAAIMLLLGTGTDYSILFLLALKRNGGSVPAAHRELSLVICLCACSAAAGFGTISWANNVGLASLGKTCALGLLIDAAISVFLLPRVYGWRKTSV